jgi:periplasmic divalent cation tolerance protein
VAVNLARALVEEGLVACANLLPRVRSIYRWGGAVEDEAEVLLLLKTTEARLPALQARVLELHPYEVPEVLALEVAGVNARYLAWLGEATRPR